MGENGPGYLRRAPFRRVGAPHGRDGRPRRRRPRTTARRELQMAAMKPRTGDGPLEVTKEGRGIVMRVPLEGGGRLVVEMSAEEASDLGDALKAASGGPAGSPAPPTTGPHDDRAGRSSPFRGSSHGCVS